MEAALFVQTLSPGKVMISRKWKQPTAFVFIDFSDILKMEHLSQTKSQASFWLKSETRNFTRNIKNSIVSGYSWMKSSD